MTKKWILKLYDDVKYDFSIVFLFLSFFMRIAEAKHIPGCTSPSILAWEGSLNYFRSRLSFSSFWLWCLTDKIKRTITTNVQSLTKMNTSETLNRFQCIQNYEGSITNIHIHSYSYWKHIPTGLEIRVPGVR